jgi:CHASE2 domain-containing sensor protein
LRDAATNWGIGHASAEVLQTVRRHWPFPAPAGEAFLSLPWKAAELAGARLPVKPEEQWLRYYGQRDWDVMSYHLALSNSPAYFRDKIVFIGNKPQSGDPTFQEDDKFRTPYTRWTSESCGGVEILATSFLNLVNGEWLRRPSGWFEGLVLVLTGLSITWGLCQFRPRAACGVAAGAGLVVLVGAVCLSYFSNYWFPWLLIAGGQAPLALVWTLATKISLQPKTDT